MVNRLFAIVLLEGHADGRKGVICLLVLKMLTGGPLVVVAQYNVEQNLYIQLYICMRTFTEISIILTVM